MTRTEPCACRGAISIEIPASDRAMLLAVAAHRRTPLHQAWSGYNDLERGPLERPELATVAEAVALALELGVLAPAVVR